MVSFKPNLSIILAFVVLNVLYLDCKSTSGRARGRAKHNSTRCAQYGSFKSESESGSDDDSRRNGSGLLHLRAAVISASELQGAEGTSRWGLGGDASDECVY